MKRNISVSAICRQVLISCFLFWSAQCWAATYYVRTDGGTADQCTGLSDSPYPGTGTGQACAWSHPFWALNASGNWKLAGGDSLIIGPGSYKLGFGAPNTGWCDAWGAYECHLPPLPSGPDSAHPTQILGVGWNQGCGSPPELWGSERPWQILSLDGTSNAVVSCLEITDHSSCVESYGGDPSLNCERDTPPYGDWAVGGIYAVNSAHVTLSHLNIHGLANFGIHAGLLSDWTVENVRIAGNGWVGWDGDTDGNAGSSACTGNMVFKDYTVEWNGCAETYPGESPTGCWAQTAGGYGDGMGLGETGGSWLFEDSIFRYNTSDGLDLLYVRDNPSDIRIKKSQSYGNAGDQIKVNGPTRIENSVMVSNCGFFDGKSFTYNVDNCRAGGSALALNPRKGSQVSVVNSTIAGQGDVLCLVECGLSGDCDGTEKTIIQNNVIMGYQDFTDPAEPEERSCYIWFEPGVFGTVSTDYNMVYNTKMGNVGLSAHDLAQNPLVVDSNLETFDGHLQKDSPAVDSGLAVGSLGGLIPNQDIEDISRPQGNGVDRGAYEHTRLPVPDIKANGQDGSITVSPGTTVLITVRLDPNNLSGQSADWWVAESGPDGVFYHFDLPSGSLVTGLLPTYQGPLFTLGNTALLSTSSLDAGQHMFYFGVDMKMNGLLDMDAIYYDWVSVNVTGQTP